MSTELEKIMEGLVKIFETHASGDGNNMTLSHKEAKNLLEAEMYSMIQVAENQAAVDKLLKALDMNGDSEVDFSEFVVLVAALTCACLGRWPKK